MTRIEVAVRAELPDMEGDRLRGVLAQAGLSVAIARTYRAYLFEGELPEAAARKLAETLLADPVLETFSIGRGLSAPQGLDRRIEILRLPGVTDPVEGSLRKAAAELGVEVGQVKCIRGVWLSAKAPADGIRKSAFKAIANPVVDEVRVDERATDYRWKIAAHPHPRTEIPLAGLTRR